MTNKLRYFVANWKMYGHLNSVKSLNKVIKFQKKNKKAKKFKNYLLSSFYTSTCICAKI